MTRLRVVFALGLLAASPLALAQHHDGRWDHHGNRHSDHHDHGWDRRDRYRYDHRPVIIHHPGYYPARRTPHGWYDRWGHFHPYRRW